MGPKDGPKPLVSNQRRFRPLRLGLGWIQARHHFVTDLRFG